MSFGTLLCAHTNHVHCTEELYLGVPSSLRDVVQWRHNRPPDLGRVETIYNEISKTGQVDGIIYVAELETRNGFSFVCFDGNHRRLALQRLDDSTGVHVLILVLRRAPHEYVRERFISLNQANPVPELYLTPDPCTEKLEHLQALVQQVVQQLVKLFPSHVSMSKSPKRPNFNRDALVDKIGQFCIENDLYEFSVHRFVRHLLELNVAYMTGKGLPVLTPRIASKCKKNRCFLFCKSFLDDVVVETLREHTRTPRVSK